VGRTIQGKDTYRRLPQSLAFAMPSSPADHRRPPKKFREYPLSMYAPYDAMRLLAKENRVELASGISGLVSSTILVWAILQNIGSMLTVL